MPDALVRQSVHAMLAYESAIVQLCAVAGWDRATAQERAIRYARTQPLSLVDAITVLTEYLVDGYRWEDLHREIGGVDGG